MFSLLAFKALNKYGDTLASPQQGMPWARAYIAPLGETYRLEAGKADLERGFGIFAGSYEEASQYGDDVYLVAPDPARPVVEAESGWRAGAAFVVAGPFESANIKEAAQVIVAAHKSGYPQVKAILGRAAFYVLDADVLIKSGSVEDLYIAACKWPDEQYDPAILDALLATGSARDFYKAGKKLPADRWSRRVIDSLIATNDAEHLYGAVLDWPDSRYDPALLSALIRTGDAHFIYYACLYISPRRWNPALARALAMTRDPDNLCRAAIYLPDDRYDPAILSALVNTGNAEYLYYAGRRLSSPRWDPAVARALALSGDKCYIELARRRWPEERRKELNV